MTPIIFFTILFLSVFSLSWMVAFIIKNSFYKVDIGYLEERMKEKDETIDRLNSKIMRLSEPDKENPEQKLKRHYFSTEKSVELARLWDQTNDRTKDTESMALLWQAIERVIPEAAYPSANLNVEDPIRFYLEWDENDKDPLKEQK